MKVRKIIPIIALVLALALLCGCGSSGSSDSAGSGYQKIDLVMAVNGTDTQIDSRVARYFADMVEEKSGGNVTVDVFPNDQLAGGNATKGIEMIAQGSVDLAAYATCTLAVIDSQLPVATIPWSFDSYADARKVIDETGWKYYAERLEKKGITYLGSFHNGFRQITNSKQPITTVADLSDIKMRICSNDLCAEVYKEWGCDASVMNWAETYTALQQGTVDGQENPETAIASASVQDVQKYISLWNAYYDCLFFCY